MSYSPSAIDADIRGVPSLAIVVPCHNEQEALPYLFRRLEALNKTLLDQRLIGGPIELVLVDDGSRDTTWRVIQAAQTELPVTGVKLSRNYGHQNALLAGLFQAKTDVVVSMDADLQDDPDAVVPMVKAYLKGAEIVYGVRDRRDRDTWFKRVSARGYYRALGALGIDLIPDHADFRLMSRKSLDALAEFGEANLFLRGLVRQLGFPFAVVKYDRAERVSGTSKYPLGKMLALGLEGITSFSVKPLRLIVLFGFAVAALAFTFGLFAFVGWASGRAVPGWTSIVLPLSLLGGVHLIALGVVGEYVGRIYQETKRRPRYIVDTVDMGEAVATTDRRVSGGEVVSWTR